MEDHTHTDMETDCCRHLQYHEEPDATGATTATRECLYRKNPWEKAGEPRVCPDDGTCLFAEDGGPFEEDGTVCAH